MAPRLAPWRGCGGAKDAPPTSKAKLPNFEIDRGSFAPLAFLDVEGDFLALGKSRPASAFNRRDVNEDVLRTIVGLDEAVALLRVEPFNRT